MSTVYRSMDISQLDLRQCRKCDCLILPDSSCAKKVSIKLEKNTELAKDQSSSDDESADSDVLAPKCHETVKIYVKGQHESYSCQEKGEQTDTHKASRTHLEHKEAQTDQAKKENLCLRFFRKKKKNKDMTQGDKENVKKTKSEKRLGKRGLEMKIQSSDMSVGEILKNCTNCGAPGGCNTNTIIFPRDKSCGDGFACLENWLRMEAKMNTRNQEDILNELHRQKRDIQELKDMLDGVVKAVREQLFMTAFGKGKNELYEDLKRQNGLERKSNALSINKSADSESKNAAVVKINAPGSPRIDNKPSPQKKTKKGFFSWCK